MISFVHLSTFSPLPILTIQTHKCALQTNYMHERDQAALRSHRWRTIENSVSFLKPCLHSGARVLDCGCGPGSLTSDIASYCGPENVIGIDQSNCALAAAAASFPHIKFLQHDVMQLPFQDAVFDVVFAHQVIQYLNDPIRALHEMKRVCKPDGIVAVRGGHIDGLLWMPQHVGFHKFTNGLKGALKSTGGDASVAGKLPMLAHRVGFQQVDVNALNWCFSKTEERERWGRLWLEIVQHGQLSNVWEAYQLVDKHDINDMRKQSKCL